MSRLYQVLLSIFITALFANSLPPSAMQAGSDAGSARGTEQSTVPPTPSLFGVQMYGNTGSGSPYFDHLVESGSSWVRVTTRWSSVEPADVSTDLYNWRSTDAAVAATIDAAAGRPIHIILTIEHAPAWAALNPNHRDGPLKTTALPALQEFVGALVERYDGDGILDAPNSPVVQYFEFYNEPDRFCGGTFGWGADGDQYAAMLKAVYPVVKAANANAQVVFGGIAYDWFNSVDKETRQCDPSALEDEWPIKGGSFVIEFLDDVLASGGGDYFDVMNFHFYTDFAANWTRFPDTHEFSVGLYEKTKYIREKLTAYGVGDKPIIITESGAMSNGIDHGDANKNPHSQAQYVLIFFVQAMAANVQVLTWWLLYDLPLSDYPRQTGLVTEDGVVKPAFRSYQTAVAQLGNAQYDRTLTPEETGTPLRGSIPTLEAHKFSRDGRAFYVAWLNPFWECGDAIQEPVPLALPETEVTVRDIYGVFKASYIDASDGTLDGQVRVPITCDAVYIESGEASAKIFLPYTAR